MRHQDELHLGRPAHRAHRGHGVLRHDHRGPAGGLRRGDLFGVGGLGARDDPAHRPDGPPVSASTTTAGALTITFTGSSNAPGGQTYTATACTNAAMTTGCVTQGGLRLGRPVHRAASSGTTYYVTVTADASSAATCPRPRRRRDPPRRQLQLALPVITAVLPSTTTAGQLTISYTGSTNAPGGQTYTATACTDVAMTTACVTHAGYASGSQFTGLVAGTSYYVTITANASSGYLAATSASSGPTAATVQLSAPTAVVPRLRHRGRVDQGHLHGLVQRPGRAGLHGEGVHERVDDDGVRDRHHLRVGPGPHGPRLRRGLAGHVSTA